MIIGDWSPQVVPDKRTPTWNMLAFGLLRGILANTAILSGLSIMGLPQRVALYEQPEKARGGRPLIVYVTSTRSGVESKMLADAIPEFLDQLTSLPADAIGVDLLVVSRGGDPMTAWRVMTLLHSRVKSVAVLIPQVAYSAATMLAMGANEIVMHPHGNLVLQL
jgi:ClpP class serine protease